ncbi:MAG: cytochrome P450 [bacterium]|nr:cytochrome P450 [bacterium]
MTSQAVESPSDERGTKMCPVDFDHNSADHALHWPQIYAEMREKCPVAWTESHGGYWVPTRHSDVMKIAQGVALFTSGKHFDPATLEVRGGAQVPVVPMVRMIPVETDAPEWNFYRGLLNPLFTPRVARTRQASVERYANAMIDRLIELGECEIAEDYNRPVPALLTMEMFGLPLSQWRQFSEHIFTIFALPKDAPGYADKVGAASEWILSRLADEIAQRRADPTGEDIISHLIRHDDGSGKLDDETIRIMCFNVIIGGVDTVNALTSNVIVYLGQNDRERKRLIENPDQIVGAMEEFVRFFSPSHALARTASRDIEMGNRMIEKGDRVLLPYSAANRDPAVFDQPDNIILDRSPNRHVGFGAGPHHCLGAHQARITFPTMLRTLLARLPDFQVDIDKAARIETVSSVNGWRSVPIKFTPGQKIGATIIDD